MASGLYDLVCFFEGDANAFLIHLRRDANVRDLQEAICLNRENTNIFRYTDPTDIILSKVCVVSCEHGVG